MFALKFYVKVHRRSDFKYSKITNRGDIGNILITCIKAIPLLLKKYPTASFGFAASRTIDMSAKRVEGIVNNQRFKAYRYVIARKIGTQTFVHFAYEQISSYLLVNKQCQQIDVKERALIKMLSETYTDLSDI